MIDHWKHVTIGLTGIMRMMEALVADSVPCPKPIAEAIAALEVRFRAVAAKIREGG